MGDPLAENLTTQAQVAAHRFGNTRRHMDIIEIAAQYL